MSVITFEDLVQVARNAQPVITDEECLTCGAEVGQPCAFSCDQRGEAAKDEVAVLVGDLPREEFVRVLRTAMERDMNGDQAPGFFWAWWVVDDEAQARGLGCPVGL
ncbi:hypothetical protein [Streptomyces sp. Root369]|uniref:hypothetical protein n=1 Tax=Streptomyces sp. Root369 TaxID=1736523 RepID=UPI00070DB545|nr:hypothetical protein [Streptomyces sp. Root369]KQW13546.1 hypothetical protein ASD08_30750 [Streptomyces sp. Root369]